MKEQEFNAGQKTKVNLKTILKLNHMSYRAHFSPIKPYSAYTTLDSVSQSYGQKVLCGCIFFP